MKSSRAWPLHHALALFLAGVFASASAQTPPASGLPHDLQRISDYVLLVDGKQVPAKMYQSDRPSAVLVTSSALPSPVLLMGSSASTVTPAAIEEKPGDMVTLRSDTVLTPQGAFHYTDPDIKFTVAGKPAILRVQPPMLGLRKADEVTTHNPEYLSSAKAYPVSGQEIATLQKEGRPVTVRVYYGSWCSHCRKLVPHAIRVEQELKGSKIRFDYFGVSPSFTSDPEVRKAVIQSIPTGIVYVNGNEVGRIIGDAAWRSPEATLRVILAASGATGEGR
jgi:thiol-disulfide isomerase/thioredoxin